MAAEPVLPGSLTERVALDLLAKTAYVDRRYAGDPLLLTWQDRNRSVGIIWTIKPVDVDELAKLRAGGLRVLEDVDVDMRVRAHAVDIIREAAAYGAADIHFMMRGEHTEIQLDVKGGLRVLARKTHEEGEALTRAIYQGLAKTRDASYNALDFQNAQIPGDALPPEAGLTSVRIVRGPCYPQAQNGSFMTLRLQYRAVQVGVKRGDLKPLALPRLPEGTLRLASMGWTEKQVDKLRALMDAPNGLVIFTGPTGSGKTTSLFEAMKESARVKPHRRQVTVEDPVEYPMEWAVQMAVTGARNDAETGAAYGERVRVTLRMAPKLILLGELRGPEVAIAALEAAVTGHLVLSTMHVTDPFLFVERLELMDRTRLERRVFCDHKIVRGVIAQRLLPRLCASCSVTLSGGPHALSPRILSALATWGDTARVRLQGDGCVHCGHDGTFGRFAVAEIVVMNAAVMRDFIGHGSEIARDNYRAGKDADPSMLETAITHVLAGQVDPRSVEDWVDLIEPKNG